MKNKDGSGNDVMFFWLFFVWVIIGGSIVIGVIIFYSSQMDVRALETNILTKKVASCLVNNAGIINNEYFEEGEARKLLSDCALSRKIIEESNYFYILANITKTEDWKEYEKPTIIKSLEIGNKDLTFQCAVKKGTKTKKFGFCEERSIYAIYEEQGVGKESIIKIFVGVNTP